MILDELPTLHQVPSLQPGLAESRQFGGCFVLGVQVISALRDLYGRNGAETISGLCGTRVVLAAPDRDTAQWSADSLGRSEVEEAVEAFSYGPSPSRDGMSFTPRREIRALALASEIMRLPNLHGYLKFPGPYPAATIELDFADRPAMAARFVPRRETPEAVRGDGLTSGAVGSGATPLEADAGHAYCEGWPAPNVTPAPDAGGDRKATAADAGRPHGSKPETAEADGSEPAARPTQAPTAPHPERNGKAGARNPEPGKGLY